MSSEPPRSPVAVDDPLYDPRRAGLYTRDELMAGYTPDDPMASLDARIGAHAMGAGGRFPQLGESLMQALHDNGVEIALRRFIGGERPHKVVGIMGGHATERSDPYFLLAAQVALALGKAGYVVATGGGLGIMEAANLGAAMSAHHGPDEVAEAVATLAEVQGQYTGNETAYVETALAVRSRFGLDEPEGSGRSLAVATWAFEGEPISQFATHIAKYFQNSVREDGLLAFATYGVVYLPGSFGTLQEIFQDATQNVTPAFSPPSPMVFVPASHYGKAPSAFEMVRDRFRGTACEGLVTLVDEPGEVVEFIGRHEAGRVPGELPVPGPAAP